MILQPSYYARIFLSRLSLFLKVFLLVLVAGVVVSLTLPQQYRAQATLLVEASQIPSDLAASTVRVDLGQQLQVIQQRLLARENLLEISDRLKLFADEPQLDPTQIVNRLRDQINVRISGSNRTVTLVTISATAKTAQISADIVNELMTQVLREDTAYRTEVATDTLSFFEREVRRLGEELDYFNRRILEFQNQNVDALPETLDYRLSRQSLLQERLSQTLREKSQLEEQRRRLVELFESTGRTDLLLQRPPTPEEQELRQLRSELRQALSVYSEQSPRVTLLRTQIEQLESVISAQNPTTVEEEEAPGVGLYKAQLVEIDSQIETLVSAAAQLEQDIATIQETIERTPANAITVGTLMRDRDNIQMQYNGAVERLSEAATGERIEVLSKGQRLSVVEQPVVPSKPATPSPRLMMALSVVMGLLLGIAAIIARELLFPTIRRAEDITKGLGITPLATLPYMDTPGEVWRQRGLRVVIILLMLAGAGGALFIVHDMVMPLNEVAQKLIAKTGLLTLAELL